MRRRRLLLKIAKGQQNIRAKYRLQATENLDASEKEKRRYTNLFDAMGFSKRKAIKRAAWIPLHVVKAAERFETADAPAAVAIQGSTSLRQYASGMQDWRLGGQMTGLKDPYGRL